LIGLALSPAGEVQYSYATGRVTTTTGASTVGGLYGEGRPASNTVFWDVETSGQSEGSGSGFIDTGRTTAQMKQLATFAPRWNSVDPGRYGITSGGGDTPWRIYEGHTYPLLRFMLEPRVVASAQPDFDGSGQPLANIASVASQVDVDMTGLDPAHVFWSSGGPVGAPVTVDPVGDTLHVTSTQAGSYTVASNASASIQTLYSDQFGYDFSVETTRVIATPGTAAGDLRLPAGGVTWTTGTLLIDVPGAITPAPMSGDRLVIERGHWNQVAGTLPAFSASHLGLGADARFLRARRQWLGRQSLAAGRCLWPQGVRGHADRHFVLDGDIDAATTATWDDGFQPIGTPQAPFSGSLDGRNRTISDLRIHRPFLAGTNQGLFGVVQGGQIRHLSLRNAQVSGYSHTGALVGHLDAAGVLDDVQSMAWCPPRGAETSSSADWSGRVRERSATARQRFPGPVRRTSADWPAKAAAWCRRARLPARFMAISVSAA